MITAMIEVIHKKFIASPGAARSLKESKEIGMAENQKESGMDALGQSNGRKASTLKKPVDLDTVLVEELGQFGCYQKRNVVLVSLALIMTGFMSEYMFSAAAVPHRCRIPECGEDSKLNLYEPEWVSNAIPETSSGFSSCQRFASSNLGTNGTLDYCPPDLFNQKETVPCDSFVYARTNSVVYEFDLGCQEWLRVLAGTLNSVGTLLVLPITGYISDRFGRKWALVINLFNLALIGLIRAFSVNYTMYLILQILQTTLGSGTFSSAYIFAAELVGPKYRVLVSALTPSMFSVGLVIVGGVAWAIESWRYMIMALHIPCFLGLSYYWLLSESVRWLLSKKRFEEARVVLETVARVNKTRISEKSMEALMNPPQPPQSVPDVEKPGLIRSIIRSPVLLRRVCTTPIWWITTTFVYYGLSINSTSLSDTMHLNFILTCAIEIPGFFTAVLILDRIGRKATLSSGYFFSAACNIAFVFIPNDMNIVRLIVFLLGKFGISIVMTSLYLFTSELYPTEYRHSLLAFSSMVGRIGSITAPLTPVLTQAFAVGFGIISATLYFVYHTMDYWQGIPSVLFGSMAVLSGLLVLTQPETLGCTMPDTLAEAEALGKKNYKLDQTS